MSLVKEERFEALIGLVLSHLGSQRGQVVHVEGRKGVRGILEVEVLHAGGNVTAVNHKACSEKNEIEDNSLEALN